MKRDVRDLFKDELEKKQLPESHRADFLMKLEKVPEKKPKKNIVGYVATVLILISGCFFFMHEGKQEVKEPTLLQQVQQIEQEYLKSIDKEWEQFLELTDDERLISKYEEKLDRLANDYQELTKRFSEQPNNINVLEELISNLQRRLQTLKDIQEHIKSLNQKNTVYETIVI